MTLEGTVAADVFELDSVTTVPPVGATLPSVALPKTLVPTRAEVGLSKIEDITGGAGVTVSVVVFVVPLYTAVIVTAVEEATPEVVIVNVEEVTEITTLAGTAATLEFEVDRVTVAPAVGAGPLKETVPVDDVPPATLPGDTLTDVSTAGVTVSVAVFVPVE